MSSEQDNTQVTETTPVQTYGDARWVTSFQAPDGTIYLHNNLKTRHGGLTLDSHKDYHAPEITGQPEGAVFWRKDRDFFLDSWYWRIELASASV